MEVGLGWVGWGWGWGWVGWGGVGLGRVGWGMAHPTQYLSQTSDPGFI
jgi:hypothetical protein